MDLLSILVALVAVISGFIKKDSKIVTFILLVLIYILFAFEHSDGDYLVYEYLFSNISIGDEFALAYEAFFVILCKTADHLGLSFDQLRYIVSFSSVLLLFFAAKKFTKNTAFVFALFFIFPALFDAELFRQLTGSCFVIFGMQYLINSKSWIDYLKYIGFVVIGALFHSSLWFCLVYMLILIRNKKTIRLMVLSIVTVILLVPGLFFTIFSHLPIREFLVQKYQTGSYSNINGIIYTSFVLFITYMMSVVSSPRAKMVKTNMLIEKQTMVYSSSENLQNKIRDLNIVALLLIVPMYFSENSERLLHIVLFYNYLALANVVTRKVEAGIYAVFAAVCLLVINLHFQVGLQNTVYTHFSEGFLINFWKVLVGP